MENFMLIKKLGWLKIDTQAVFEYLKVQGTTKAITINGTTFNAQDIVRISKEAPHVARVYGFEISVDESGREYIMNPEVGHREYVMSFPEATVYTMNLPILDFTNGKNGELIGLGEPVARVSLVAEKPSLNPTAIGDIISSKYDIGE